MSVKLYMGNLPYSAKAEDLALFCTTQGFPPRGVKLLVHPHGGSKGSAFVDVDAEVAENAIATLNGVAFLGRDLRVSLARHKQRNPKLDPAFDFEGER